MSRPRSSTLVPTKRMQGSPARPRPWHRWQMRGARLGAQCPVPDAQRQAQYAATARAQSADRCSPDSAASRHDRRGDGGHHRYDKAPATQGRPALRQRLYRCAVFPLPQALHNGCGDCRTVHSVQVQTGGTVLLKVAKLTGGIIYTGCLQTLGVVLVLGENLDDGEGSDAPHIKTMRLICDLPINGMIPAVMGTVMPALSASSRKR